MGHGDRGIVLELVQSGASITVLPEQGGLLFDWTVVDPGGRKIPVLWTNPDLLNDASASREDFPGGMPVLFPVCGPTGGYRVDGGEGACDYEMPKHGFAARKAFSMPDLSLRQAEKTGVLSVTLTSHRDTLCVYPFPFELTLDWGLAGPSSLSACMTVKNCGGTIMPVSPGLHPYFNLPFMEAGTRQDVSLDSTARARYVLSPQGWTGETMPLDAGRISLSGLPSGPAYMIGDFECPELTVEDAASNLGLTMRWTVQGADGNGFVNLWTSSKEVRMFCIEPVCGPTNALNHGTGLFWIPPDERWTMRVQFEIEMIFK
jgi:galactose mutarotase-like enzyme